MGRASQTQLVPMPELTTGQIITMRNSIIQQVVALAARELNMPEEQLVVRDIEPYTDLGMDYGTASAGSSETWIRDFTGVVVGYTSVVGTTASMGDQRYVAIFGVRDLRAGLGATVQDATTVQPYGMDSQPVSLIKFTVGGAVKSIWDLSGLSAYPDRQVGFSPAGVLIPQNASFNIEYYQKTFNAVGTAKSIQAYLQMLGVTVEPRGKTISP